MVSTWRSCRRVHMRMPQGQHCAFLWGMCPAAACVCVCVGGG